MEMDPVSVSSAAAVSALSGVPSARAARYADLLGGDRSGALQALYAGIEKRSAAAGFCRDATVFCSRRQISLAVSASPSYSGRVPEADRGRSFETRLTRAIFRQNPNGNLKKRIDMLYCKVF